jgi:microcystin-dependent protein
MSTSNPNVLPIGTIMAFAGPNTTIANFLLCDGSLVSTSEYQNLFNVISYTYGGSDSSFNLPDLRNRRPWMDGTLGQTGGQNTTTLTENQIPQHTHNITSFSSTHSHSLINTNVVTGVTGGAGGGVNEFDIVSVNDTSTFNVPSDTYTGSTTTSLVGTTGNNSTSQDSVNLQNPFLKMYYYIRY